MVQSDTKDPLGLLTQLSKIAFLNGEESQVKCSASRLCLPVFQKLRWKNLDSILFQVGEFDLIPRFFNWLQPSCLNWIWKGYLTAQQFGLVWNVTLLEFQRRLSFGVCAFVYLNIGFVTIVLSQWNLKPWNLGYPLTLTEPLLRH